MTPQERAFDARYGDAWREEESFGVGQGLSYLAIMALTGGAVVLKKSIEFVREAAGKVLNK